MKTTPKKIFGVLVRNKKDGRWLRNYNRQTRSPNSCEDTAVLFLDEDVATHAIASYNLEMEEWDVVPTIITFPGRP